MLLPLFHMDEVAVVSWMTLLAFSGNAFCKKWAGVLRLCVSCCTKQLSLTPAFPRESATVSRVKGSCHNTGWVSVCGCVCVHMKYCVVSLHLCGCVCRLSFQGKWLLSCVRSVQPLGQRAVKGTLFPPAAADREPLQHTGGAERETLCVCMWTEGREMAIDPKEGDGNGKGPSMCTSAFHNISNFSDLTI